MNRAGLPGVVDPVDSVCDFSILVAVLERRAMLIPIQLLILQMYTVHSLCDYVIVIERCSRNLVAFWT